jgi:fructose-1,6-bisphosphatase/inositol monophosphatase family enzyme
MLLVKEAEGVVTSFQGEAVNPFVSERIGIIANAQLHPLRVNLLGTME